jgi:hypothetical protein
MSSKKSSHVVNQQSSSERKTSIDQSFESSSRLQLAAKDVCDSLAVVCTSPAESDNEDISVTSSSLVPKSTKYEHLRKTGASKMKVLADGFKAEKATASNQELRRLQSNDSSIEERSSMAALKAKMEGNGFSASKMAAIRQDQKQMQIGDTMHQHQSSAKASSMSLCTDDSLTQKKSFERQKEERTISQGIIHQEKNSASHSSSHFISNKSTSKALNNFQFRNQNEIESQTQSPIIQEPFSPTILSLTNEVDMEFNVLSLAANNFNTAFHYNNTSNTECLNMKGSMAKLERKMSNLAEKLKGFTDSVEKLKSVEILTVMTDMIRKAWSVPQCGYDLGFNMCKIIRNSGALDVLIENCSSNIDWRIQFLSAQLLEQCLISENRDYVVEKGLSDVVEIACKCISMNSDDETRVGTGLLEHLFKHSEDTCKEVISMGGLESILYECRSTDITTLRHCASALANLSLYGGPDNQVSMIKQKAPVWLFPLAFHNDDNIKYYACLAIAVLVANKEVEAAVLKSGTLDLVEPFISSHNPQDFAKSSTSHIHGQSMNWLKRLVPVLDSKREEARSLAAFHFAMEAWIKKTQEHTSVCFKTL